FPLHISQLTQPLLKSRQQAFSDVSRGGRQKTEAGDRLCLLRVGGEGRPEDAEDESDDASHARPPHDHLLTSFLCVPHTPGTYTRPEHVYLGQPHAALPRRRWKPQRRRSVGWKRSPARACSARSPRPGSLPRCPPHAYWITSSARTSRDAGIVIPSILAVL